MSNWQHQKNVALIILSALALCAIYILASGDLATMYFHSKSVATIKWCFSVADYVQELGEGVFRDWQQADRSHRIPFLARPPLHIACALRSSEFAADVLRDTGSFLAAKLISYRNYGSSNPFSTSPARIVLAARSLFLADQVLGVSTWVPKVWP